MIIETFHQISSCSNYNPNLLNYFRNQNMCCVVLQKYIVFFFIWVSVRHKSVIYDKPTRYNSGSIVFINNYKYALHVSGALCVHHQEHYKL